MFNNIPSTLSDEPVQNKINVTICHRVYARIPTVNEIYRPNFSQKTRRANGYVCGRVLDGGSAVTDRCAITSSPTASSWRWTGATRTRRAGRRAVEGPWASGSAAVETRWSRSGFEASRPRSATSHASARPAGRNLQPHARNHAPPLSLRWAVNSTAAVSS